MDFAPLGYELRSFFQHGQSISIHCFPAPLALSAEDVAFIGADYIYFLLAVFLRIASPPAAEVRV